MPNHHRRLLVLKIAVALGVTAGAGLLDSRNAAMAAAPWCAYMGGFSGSFDCSYYTFEQCMATARGLGGSCAQNPVWIYGQEGRQRRPRN
jgi:Protein of unknown function (DUF3551)